MRVQGAQLGRGAPARTQLLDLLVEQSRLERGDLVALPDYLVGQALVALFEPAKERGLVGHGLARRPGAGNDLRILGADAVHEVNLIEQLAEPVRLEDHADQVRPSMLVGRDQIGGQRVGRALEPVLEVHQAVARLQQRGLHVPEFVLASRQLVLELGQVLIGGGEPLSGGVDLRRVTSDLRAQRGRRRLPGADLALEIPRARGGQAASQQHRRDDQDRGGSGGSEAVADGRHADGREQHKKARGRPVIRAPRRR